MKWNQKWKLKKPDLKDKNTWLVFGLIGILLLVIALPTESRTEREKIQQEEASRLTQQNESEQKQSETDQITQSLEQRLAEMLALIDGAGKVRVMITLKDKGEKVVEKDVTNRTERALDNEGMNDTSENSVYVRSGSEETPYISNELTPQVEGVLVVAQGGGNSLVKQNILQSVMALFPLEAHKITIVKMSMQEVGDHENF